MSEVKNEGKRTNPHAFEMGVFLNLLSLQADSLHASHRRNTSEAIDKETAHAMAERAYKLVSHWFTVADESGMWASMLERFQSNIIVMIAETLVDPPVAEASGDD